MNPNNDYLDMN